MNQNGTSYGILNVAQMTFPNTHARKEKATAISWNCPRWLLGRRTQDSSMLEVLSDTWYHLIDMGFMVRFSRPQLVDSPGLNW